MTGDDADRGRSAPWRVFDDHPCQLGESPVWDDRRGCLWWIDGRVGTVFRRGVQPAGPRMERRFGRRIGSIGLTAKGRILIAFSHTIEIWDPETDRLALLSAPQIGEYEAFNDGKTGPDAAFWIGTKGVDPQGNATGRLYRITPDGQAEPKVEGLMTANGLAWSGDERTLFLSDSKGQWIDGFDFDPAGGAVTRRRRLRTTSEAFGRPDGAATDMADSYWSCGVSAGCINRLGPAEAHDRISAPVSAPTMVGFGGPELATVFLTSLRRADAGPDCGKVFCMPAPIAGVPLTRFDDSL